MCGIPQPTRLVRLTVSPGVAVILGDDRTHSHVVSSRKTADYLGQVKAAGDHVGVVADALNPVLALVQAG